MESIKNIEIPALDKINSVHAAEMGGGPRVVLFLRYTQKENI